MLGVELRGKIHEQGSGRCPRQVGSSSDCSEAAAHLRKVGGQKVTLQVLKVGDYALQRKATPLNETSVLVGWGEETGAHNQWIQCAITFGE